MVKNRKMSFAILTGILSIWVSSLFSYILCEFSFIDVTSRSVNFFESGLFFRQPYHSKCIIIYHVAYARNLGVILMTFPLLPLTVNQSPSAVKSTSKNRYCISSLFCSLPPFSKVSSLRPLPKNSIGYNRKCGWYSTE